jgi:hypothetical protein
MDTLVKATYSVDKHMHEDEHTWIANSKMIHETSMASTHTKQKLGVGFFLFDQ